MKLTGFAMEIDFETLQDYGLEILLIFAGEVHNCYHQWQDIIGVSPSAQQVQVLKWIKDKVSIFEYFQPFSGSFIIRGSSIMRIIHLRNISGIIRRVSHSPIL